MKIALDVMGGDRAPEATVRGALLAVEQGQVARENVLLVGLPEAVEKELEKAGAPSDSFQVQAASQVVGMGESPAEALRKKRDSSVLVAAMAVKQKAASALVSAGNTGAAVAASVRLWKTLPGVRRPGIAVTFEGEKGTPVTIIDVGANINCTPADLLNYGYMGSFLSSIAYGARSPRVGLMNIGSEDEKGNQLIKTTHALFRETGLNFVGNVEGRDLFSGACEIIVCEGFVGNVILKVGEGLSEHLLRVFYRELQSAGVDPGVTGKVVEKIRKRMDYSEYGGALLLGVDGTCVICHGHSDPKAIANALGLATKAVESGLNDKISKAILERREGGRGEIPADR